MLGWHRMLQGFTFVIELKCNGLSFKGVNSLLVTRAVHINNEWLLVRNMIEETLLHMVHCIRDSVVP